MSDRDLALNALNYGPVSRVPTGFWFHLIEEAETGDFMKNPKLLNKNVAGHKKFIGDFQPDLVKIMSDGFFFFPVSTLVEQASDLRKIEILSPDHPWLIAQIELIDRVRALKKETLYFYNVFSPANFLRFLVGREKVKLWANQNPKELKEALERLGQSLALLAVAAIREGGADGIYFSVQNPDLGEVTDEIYRQIVAPSELLVLEASHKESGLDILHICGYDGVRNNLSFYSSYPAKAVSWAVNVEGVSLLQGRSLFDGRAVVGGFPNTKGSILHTGNKAQIQDMTKRIIDEAGREGLIIGADCTVPSDINLRHLDWVRQAAL
ncbi:MAG: uroporphyrinogen decarboxylase [Deltaproteobacteria bacterium]|jgi:uroporphyrinogen decarboxylase|nr:uroporphyrinogen decarboxylase [Deltaproteobacteria bacterium]